MAWTLLPPSSKPLPPSPARRCTYKTSRRKRGSHRRCLCAARPRETIGTTSDRAKTTKSLRIICASAPWASNAACAPSKRFERSRGADASACRPGTSESSVAQTRSRSRENAVGASAASPSETSATAAVCAPPRARTCRSQLRRAFETFPNLCSPCGNRASHGPRISRPMSTATSSSSRGEAITPTQQRPRRGKREPMRTRSA
mmetsp:Transcript_25779/g.86614  ORF Transcript_25779/g.86614 Transcript_25779/m.86614 type:complete len:203 (-) Transcript_25779:6-614(-)